MARTKQTARKSVGGKAPRKGMAIQQNTKAKSTTAIAEENLKVSVEYDVSYESSFYAHFFETGSEHTKTFAPRYAVANIKDQANEDEFWLSVNFNSKFDGEGIKTHGRPVINLVVALDISGSMQSSFVGDEEESTEAASKLDVAKQSILSILSQLKEDDSFGVLTFDTGSKVIHPLKKLKDTNLVELQNTIKGIEIGGGTHVTQALVASTKMYEDVEEGTNSSNRVFFLTDMEVGSDDGATFVQQVKKNSDDSKWTTVVGVGLDLTSTIIENVSKSAGCNYANVRSTKNFKELMDKEFGYLVTPIGFNISVEMKSAHFKIEKGYGSPEIANMKPGDPVHISTEFPSAQNEKGERRAGALLFKVKRTNPGSNKFQMIVKHENLQGIVETDSQDLEFVSGYQDNGIRKSIVLIKYTDFMKNYLEERKKRQSTKTKKYDPKYKNSLLDFVKILASEKVTLSDDSIQQEIEFLETLAELESDPAELKAKALAEENKALVSKLDSMTVTDLKKELKKRKLSEKGTKEELIARLKEYLEKPENSKPTEENGKEEETKKEEMEIDEDDDEDDDDNDDYESEEDKKGPKRKSPRTKVSAKKPQVKSKKLKK